MSVIAKCFLVVFALFCCLQLAEMARVPRSDPTTNNNISVDDISKQLSQLAQGLSQTLQKLSENEQLKELGKSLEGAVKEGLNKLSDGANEITTKLKQN